MADNALDDPSVPPDGSSAPRRIGFSPIAPTPFGKYMLVAKLGQGATSEVFLAVVSGPAGFRKPVVLKRLYPNLVEEPGIVDMFQDEARLAARLNHPHVVQTLEVGQFEGFHFIAMEYLEGVALDRVLSRAKQMQIRIPPPLSARIVYDALEGLGHAHQLTDFDGTPMRVVHRDVSPQNVFITFEGVVKLLDFGVAKAATSIARTETGVVKGKYAYIAPEQALDEGIDERADLWSTGVVLWELLAARRLFKSSNEVATLQKALTAPIPALSTYARDVAPDLQSVVSRALERDPSRRYRSAAQMQVDLERYLAAQGPSPGRQEIRAFVRETFADMMAEQKRALAACLDLKETVIVSSPAAGDPTTTGSFGTVPAPTRPATSWVTWLGIVSALGMIAVIVFLLRPLFDSSASDARQGDRQTARQRVTPNLTGSSPEAAAVTPPPEEPIAPAATDAGAVAQGEAQEPPRAPRARARRARRLRARRAHVAREAGGNVEDPALRLSR